MKPQYVKYLLWTTVPNINSVLPNGVAKLPIVNCVIITLKPKEVNVNINQSEKRIWLQLTNQRAGNSHLPPP